MTDRITEKKLKNKRFQKTEAAIITAFFLTKDKLSLERLLRLAKISRSTLYRHHKNIHEIAPDYEKYILRKCKNTLSYFMWIKKTYLKILFQRILVFLSANQLIMNFLLEYGSNNLIERIVAILKPKLLTAGKITDGEMFTLYAKEVAGLIEIWCRAGFNKDDILPTVDKIIYLTNTAHDHFAPIVSSTAPPKNK